MKLKYDFAIAEFGEKRVVVFTGEGMNFFRGYIKTDRIGASIFEMLREDISEEKLVERMTVMYPEEERKNVDAAVKAFVRKLTAAGIIRIKAGEKNDSRI